MKTLLSNYLYDLLGLFYPNLCLACEKNLPPGQKILCIRCNYSLPKTNYHLELENGLTERFWGRLPIETGAALFHFVKGGKVQQLIHELKYNHKRDVGIQLGEWYGSMLKEQSSYQDIDLIVPVPLHIKKEHRRGYNQSALFAEGLAKRLGKPWKKDALMRRDASKSQTKKGRMERLENVMHAFQLNKAKSLEGKHILLVDDVLTTGATLEACGQKLLSIANTKLSLATIAIAS